MDINVRASRGSIHIKIKLIYVCNPFKEILIECFVEDTMVDDVSVQR